MTISTKSALSAAAALVVFLAFGCSDPSSGDDQPPVSTPQLRFHNLNQQTSVGGTVTSYRIRNLVAWDSTWNDTIEYDGYSAYKQMVAGDTAVPVRGEYERAAGDWRATTWTAHVPPGITGPLTVELRFGE